MGIDQTMSDFDQMQYQTQVARELTHIVQAKKIPNALLFSGNESTGKKQAAFLFAKGCNCLNHKSFGCTECISCAKIEAGSHPDILLIDLEKDKKNISIAQVRNMGSRICSRPNEAKFRMVLILHADKMNIQAQNALLKMLEEPPDKTFFILSSTQEMKLLPTIHSRCRKVRFKPLSEAFIATYLKNHYQLDDMLCHIVSKTSGSDLKKALVYSNLDKETQKTDWVKKRKWLLTTIESIIKSKKPASISKGMMLSFYLNRDPDLITDCLMIMKTFFRDLMIVKFHPKKIVNLDFFETFADINQKASQTIFYNWMQELLETEKRIASNSSPRLTLDRFFLEIATNKGSLIYD